MRGHRKFCQRACNSDDVCVCVCVFLLMRGERIQMLLKAVIIVTFRWRSDDAPTLLNAGLVAL